MWAIEWRMYPLTELSNQHDAALGMADRLIELIDDYRCEEDALPIAVQFSKLVGLLCVHLAQEDVQLYPKLVASDDGKTAKLALAFVAEMGGLALELELLARRWSSSAVIAGDFAEFAEATRELILQLAVRIERENRYLYPLARSVEEAAGSPAPYHHFKMSELPIVRAAGQGCS